MKKMGKERVGDVYGDLVITGYENGKYTAKCTCGVVKEYFLGNMKRVSSTSCGCKRGEKVSRKLTTHGERQTRLYSIWTNIKSRCTNKNATSYKYYGGKGIGFTSDWIEYENFRDWANKNGYKEHLTIDRIDNAKGYYPSNCRWVDNTVQSRNRDYAWYINIDGVSKHAKDWCEIYGIGYKTLHNRVSKGWSEKEALSKPVEDRSYDKEKKYAICIGGKILSLGTLDELSEKENVKKKTLHWYGSKSYKERIKREGKENKKRILIEVVSDE